MEQLKSISTSPQLDTAASEIARWGFFLCGIVLIAAAAILPLNADLEWTRHQTNLALVAEQENIARNESYANMIEAIEKQNPDTLRLLAQSNMGLIPATHDALISPGQQADPMMFELLEPAALDRPVFAPQYSRLEKMVMVPTSRLWVIAGGILLVLIGILPAAKPK
ncbi:MAG: hypothetical protein JKY43_10285 [Phycisphaerales bacterium]|nr:hypothetical protein [Phycisphaerales bacterium]